MSTDRFSDKFNAAFQPMASSLPPRDSAGQLPIVAQLELSILYAGFDACNLSAARAAELRFVVDQTLGDLTSARFDVCAKRIDFRRAHGRGAFPYRDNPSALGSVNLIDEIIAAAIHPHPDVFSELWTRHVYGGPMPSTFQFSVQGEGESWRRDLSWDGKNPSSLPIVSASFSMRADTQAGISGT